MSAAAPVEWLSGRFAKIALGEGRIEVIQQSAVVQNSERGAALGASGDLAAVDGEIGRRLVFGSNGGGDAAKDVFEAAADVSPGGTAADGEDHRVIEATGGKNDGSAAGVAAEDGDAGGSAGFDVHPFGWRTGAAEDHGGFARFPEAQDLFRAGEQRIFECEMLLDTTGRRMDQTHTS